MSIIVLFDRGDRSFACRLIERAKPGSRFELLPPRHTEEQDRKLRAMLQDVSRQYRHCGRFYEPEQWKLLFLHACGQECEFAPSLDGSTLIPFGGSTTRMGVVAMSELISFIDAWCAQNGVELRG